MTEQYDVIVVGAGHAGCEAAFASARMGAHTLLVTMNLDTIALMSCNPAIGGLAKGHLVREVDALGGVMGLATDQTGIQFRMLNMSKGPAVRAPRAQADKLHYSRWMKQFMEAVPGLELAQGMVQRLLYGSYGTGVRVEGVEMQCGTRIGGRTVILTTGTFLDGIIHVGARSYPAGRAGEPSATGLSESLREAGIVTSRLKTGTPARLDRRSINWDILEPQHGDVPPCPFSYLTERITQDQVPCHITYTNADTHRVILDNLDKSAMYGGRIHSVGPRYCPSIEDKCVRFADKDRHQIFLEPEGRTSGEIYVNGMSTSLPEDVQTAFLRTIRGLERSRIVRFGYAIEYTFVQPSQIRASLESRAVGGLFLAGQTNGTTGYEEAAALGLMAGVNAVLHLRDEEPFVLRRDEGYIGVLVDDLITKEHKEPYRMFTSRAEYRLLLRQDNADLRLTDHARRLGLIDEARYARFGRYRETIQREIDRLERTTLRPSEIDANLAEEYGLAGMQKGIRLSQFLTRPGNGYEDLVRLGMAEKVPGGENTEEGYSLSGSDLERAKEQIELSVKYDGYIARQKLQVERALRLESTRLPQDLNYDGVRGLTREAQQKLAALRPETMGQASRIAGVNPADITVLIIHLRAKAG